MRIADRLDMKLESGSVPVHLTDFLEGRGRPGHSGPPDGASRRSIFVSGAQEFSYTMMSTFDALIL